MGGGGGGGGGGGEEGWEEGGRRGGGGGGGGVGDRSNYDIRSKKSDNGMNLQQQVKYPTAVISLEKLNILESKRNSF